MEADRGHQMCFVLHIDLVVSIRITSILTIPVVVLEIYELISLGAFVGEEMV